MAILHKARNPDLWTPLRQPRRIGQVDPSHPLAGKLQLAVTAIGGVPPVDLAQSQAPTAIGGPPGWDVNLAGRVFSFTAAGQNFVYGGRATAQPSEITFLWVGTMTTTANAEIVGNRDSTNTGWALASGGSGLNITKGGVAAINLGLLAASGVPYVVAASASGNGATVRSAILNLATGALSTPTAGANSTAPKASDGAFNVGGASVFPLNNHRGTTALAAFSYQAFDLATLAAFAMNPWALFLPAG